MTTKIVLPNGNLTCNKTMNTVELLPRRNCLAPRFSEKLRVSEFIVLAHGFPNKPILDDELGSEFDVICGAGIDLEVFVELLYDDDFLERVRKFCTQHQCNQIVASLRGYPTGFCHFVTDELIEPI
jgi:hypothetical protein